TWISRPAGFARYGRRTRGGQRSQRRLRRLRWISTSWWLAPPAWRRNLRAHDRGGCLAVERPRRRTHRRLGARRDVRSRLAGVLAAVPKPARAARAVPPACGGARASPRRRDRVGRAG